MHFSINCEDIFGQPVLCSGLHYEHFKSYRKLEVKVYYE